LFRLEDVDLDSRSIPQASLDIAAKERSNPLAWNGQFSPQLVQVLLQAWASRNGLVVDPFLGSGTLLVEAARLDLPCFGTEINPAACALASVYELTTLTPRARAAALAAATHVIDAAAPRDPLFATRPASAPGEALLAACAAARSRDVRRLLHALIVLLDIGRRPLDADIVGRAWSRLHKIVDGLPYTRASVQLEMGDARQLSCAAQTVDLVLTSPPYINVFNYHQHYRGSVEALGWDALAVARSEIGANRKHRSNRFLTVIQYCLDMAAVLREVRRVLTSEGRAIFVVGRVSNVRGTPFYNGAIIASLATACAGLRLVCRQERVFTNRFGERIYEDILHLVPSAADSLDPGIVARDVLEDALRRSTPDVAHDLKAALRNAASVEASPLFQRSNRS
jgi:hypothetical protein